MQSTGSSALPDERPTMASSKMRASAGGEIAAMSTLIQAASVSVERFIRWLNSFGETSYDHQSCFASPLTRRAKALYYRRPLLGTLAVAPMICCEALLPSARRFFWKKERLPIADAHYTMGFAFLAQVLNSDQYYRRAVHFLDVLQSTRCQGYEHHCWGYPFDWETRLGTLKAGTPMITTVPYVYEAFRQVYEIDRESKWLDIMYSIAQHVLEDYHELDGFGRGAGCSYTPLYNEQGGGVVNASAYRACMLTQAAYDLCEERYQRAAARNLAFVIDAQNVDGSWNYSTDDQRQFIDHFHTCFVLKALAKIERLTGNESCTNALDRGVEYYVRNLFDGKGHAMPFSRRPRITVYRRELYDLAECINLAVLLRGRYQELDRLLIRVLDLESWQKPDGSFRSRQLLFGWDNVPMHRWGQSQVFRSLCFLLYETQAGAAGVRRER